MPPLQVRLPRAERRLQILRAAGAAFLAAGYDGTSMDDVARAAGVSRLIVYRIFETKERLYESVLGLVPTALKEEFEAAGPDAVAPRVLRAARRVPDAFRLLWRHAAHEPAFAHHADEFRTHLDAFADALIARRVPDPALRRWAAHAVVTHLYDGVCSWLDAGDPGRDEEFAGMMGAGLRSLVDAWSAPVAQPVG